MNINSIYAQGPPITGDKPIMLGEGAFILKSLVEFQKNGQGEFLKFPLMFHYIPTSYTLVAFHLPWIYRSDTLGKGGSLGDIELLAKYQFYRKDNIGKTFRILLKSIQRLPTGKDLGKTELSTGKYRNYVGIIMGYESLKYGISNEFAHALTLKNTKHELFYKLGIGLPLLKQTYPVKQINLYFEYENTWTLYKNHYLLLYTQGIQYAYHKCTFEIAVQFPLIKIGPQESNYSIFFGSRYIF